MIGEIVERQAGAVRPPSAPKARTAPKKWKQPAPTASESGNMRQMSSWTPEQAAEAANELSQLDPAVLAMLKRRAQKHQPGNWPEDVADHIVTRTAEIFTDESSELETPPAGLEPALEPNQAPETSHGPNSSPGNDVGTEGVHFPPPPEELAQYFPDVPVETSKLAWMQPVSEAEEAEYSPSLVSVAPSELRFDFQGHLLTPRQAMSIPVSEGLHHHGDAPSAAGYTLVELARLARSSHSGQRALAIRTAGRILHRLRNGKFNRSSDLQAGLEALVQDSRLMDTIYEASSEQTRSLTVRNAAVQALWLAEATGPKSGLGS